MKNTTQHFHIPVSFVTKTMREGELITSLGNRFQSGIVLGEKGKLVCVNPAAHPQKEFRVMVSF